MTIREALADAIAFIKAGGLTKEDGLDYHYYAAKVGRGRVEAWENALRGVPKLDDLPNCDNRPAALRRMHDEAVRMKCEVKMRAKIREGLEMMFPGIFGDQAAKSGARFGMASCPGEGLTKPGVDMVDFMLGTGTATLMRDGPFTFAHQGCIGDGKAFMVCRHARCGDLLTRTNVSRMDGRAFTGRDLYCCACGETICRFAD